MHQTAALIVLAATFSACAQPHAPQPGVPEALDWKSLEAPFLTGHVQLTSRDQFVKAGEAYFDPTTTWVIFQATPVPAEGAAPDPFYSMYAARLVKSPDGAVSAIETPILLSPPGSWNSCGWFSPTTPGEVLFSSTLVTPKEDQKGGFQVGTRRYQWLFPDEAEMVSLTVPRIAADLGGGDAPTGAAPSRRPSVIFSLPEYQAEGSYSPDGRFILYAGAAQGAQKDPNGRTNIDLFIYDLVTTRQHTIVAAPGYDGGPFFSPDGKWICYRSDREMNDLLQIFIAELDYQGGVPVGIRREVQLTNNGAVNWAPYWHPSGQYLVYGSSELGHHNYEVFAVDAKPGTPFASRKRTRVTHADGADVLPVFSADGAYMMWTGQRGPLAGAEDRPSSQLWIARAGALPK